MRVAGIVLCGGHSRRMGRPKAWLPFGPEWMLPRVVRLLAEAVQPVVVVAAVGQDVPPLPAGVAVVRDARSERGPLQGLASGLEAVRGQADAVYVSSCDTPLLRPPFVQRLVELLGPHKACAVKTGECAHPLGAAYRLNVADVVERLLAEDQLRLSKLLDIVPTRLVTPEEVADVDPHLESLRNLNTAAEYEAAVRAASGESLTPQTPPPPARE